MKRICLSKGIITTDTTSKVQSIQSELEADRAALVFKAFAETKVESSLGMQVNFKVLVFPDDEGDPRPGSHREKL